MGGVLCEEMRFLVGFGFGFKIRIRDFSDSEVMAKYGQRECVKGEKDTVLPRKK